MRIAFDATVLHGRKSGVGYYCEELLKSLLAINDGDEFFVFSHRPVVVDFPESNGNPRFAESWFCPIRAVYLHVILPKLLHDVRPDLCHYTNFLAPVRYEHTYVVTIHDMGLETLRHCHPLAKRLYTRRLIPRAARNAKLILTNSEYSKWEIVRHLRIREDRIRVTPLAASPEFRPIDVSVDRPYFLYVGNIEPRKNLGRLLDAFAKLDRKDHELWIVGMTWYGGRAVVHKAHSLGLNGRVRFLGYVPRVDLPRLFSGATAFVYPSLLEGFGLPVLEAMACGTPVITSNNSALKDLAGEAAVLVDATDVGDITRAMRSVAEDDAVRKELSMKGLKRAAAFSWDSTARLTMDAYREALDLRPAKVAASTTLEDIRVAIRKTIGYAGMFQYPLKPEELRERLFDVEADESSFHQALASLELRQDENLLGHRAERERITDEAIREVREHLCTLASMPFIRMVAFSGSTAHRNMTTAEDVDLFLIVEDGKLWAVFLLAMLWAKAKGLRKKLCMNYLITDAALPLFEHDPFTAQQVASLKPIFGKALYDRFVDMNPFVRRHFPNFDPRIHREAYPEISPGPVKRLFETVLSLGLIQVLEPFSRMALRWYLGRKANRASRAGRCDVLLEPRRLKLHLSSHKETSLERLSSPHPPLRGTLSQRERN